MEITDYSSKYDEEIKDLFLELQEHIALVDGEKYNIVTSEFKEVYFKKVMENISSYEGKIFLAKEEEKIIGVIIGLINNDEEETYDFKAPRRGRITDLVVSKEARFKGVGESLLTEMENYFKSVGCKGVLLDVFAYNTLAYNFYLKRGYFNRNIEMMKKI